MEEEGHNVCLVGDSVLDNALYVRGRPCVAQQLLHRLNGGTLTDRPRHLVSLVAIDGDVMRGVMQTQVGRIPRGTTHVVLSVGGNDCLREFAALRQRKNPFVLARALLDFSARFREEYADTVDALADAITALGDRGERDWGEEVAETEIPSSDSSRLGGQNNLPLGGQEVSVSLCTVYLPQFLSRFERTLAAIGLRAVNDAIRKEAALRKYSLIDCWELFDQPHDFANPIEPGVPGGDKIVTAIEQVLFDEAQHVSHVAYSRPVEELNLLRLRVSERDGGERGLIHFDVPELNELRISENSAGKALAARDAEENRYSDNDEFR